MAIKIACRFQGEMEVSEKGRVGTRTGKTPPLSSAQMHVAHCTGTGCWGCHDVHCPRISRTRQPVDPLLSNR